MIVLTKLNDIEFVLNCDLIETVLENPDTTIRLTDGNMYIVKESMQEIINKTVKYKKAIYSDMLSKLIK
ncbi:MAG: flagellar FlbD family protein [Oscillospiraceae bacterium]